jgi:hypothetical protein
MEIDTPGKSTHCVFLSIVSYSVDSPFSPSLPVGRVDIKAMARLLGIVHMNPEVDPSEWDHTEEDMYGIGGVRTPEKFYKLFGIDVVEKTTQHLCKFVPQGRMHKEFVKLLRDDGLGIDFSRTNFQWVDPNPEK